MQYIKSKHIYSRIDSSTQLVINQNHWPRKFSIHTEQCFVWIAFSFCLSVQLLSNNLKKTDSHISLDNCEAVLY